MLTSAEGECYTHIHRNQIFSLVAVDVFHNKGKKSVFFSPLTSEKVRACVVNNIVCNTCGRALPTRVKFATQAIVSSPTRTSSQLHGENFMAIFTTRSVVIWFSTGTLGIFAILVYVFTMRVVIYTTY